MGAVHRYDLTLDTTHLIVGEYNTPKYRYVAKERPDVRPMSMEWIDALRELWIADQEIDVVTLEKEHLLPVFHSLKFSMTGCDDRMDTNAQYVRMLTSYSYGTTRDRRAGKGKRRCIRRRFDETNHTSDLVSNRRSQIQSRKDMGTAHSICGMATRQSGKRDDSGRGPLRSGTSST